MGTALFTWELGGGLGHLMAMSPLVKALAADGHRVVLATKDVLSAHRLFSEDKVELLGTPRSGIILPYPRQYTLAHLMANVGFSDSIHLESHCNVWKTIYDQIKPDLIVFNHSPVALLAARTVAARRALLGSGFFIPPDVYPLPAFRPELPLDWPQIRAVEDSMLKRINALLEKWRQPPLERIGQLNAQVDEIFLATYAELDHFPIRNNAEYFGAINDGSLGGKYPIWPATSGKKIYGYLKPFQSLHQLLKVLNESKQPTLIFSDGIDARTRAHFSSSTLRFETERLNMASAADGCSLGVINAGHSTTAMMMKAGKPCLMIPLQEEQGIIARRIQQQEAGLGVFMDRPATYAQAFKLLMEDPRYQTGAANLAAKINAIDLTAKRAEILARTRALI